MQTFAEANWEIDESALAAERDPQLTQIINDRDVRLLLRENRLALAKGTAAPVLDQDGATAGYDIPLCCVVHAHPECRFQWARVLVDLRPTSDARIHDMSPREVVDDRPVELKTTVGVGLKFNVATSVLGGEIRPEYSSSRTVYFPEILSSGVGFDRGYWDFLTRGATPLHVDRELRILVAAPDQRPVIARFSLRARVRLAGVGGLVPLLARGASIEGTYQLTK
jgi:hypothetical protein